MCRKIKPVVTSGQIQSLLEDSVLFGPCDREVVGTAAISSPHAEGRLAFCKFGGMEAIEAIRQSKASLILAKHDVAHRAASSSPDTVLIGVTNPRLSFIKAADAFFGTDRTPQSDHAKTAAIDPAVQIGRNVRIGHFAVIEGECGIGDHCDIGPHVVVHAGSKIGSAVVLQAGAVVGADGFGFERGVGSELHRFPHSGRVCIGNNVEVGARACIDRGALGDTVIGNGTKIDDGAYIAHNVTVGKNCLIMSNAILCGSCVIGDNVDVSPGAVIRDGVNIGSSAQVGLGAVVTRDVPEGTLVAGVPARAMPQRLS